LRLADFRAIVVAGNNEDPMLKSLLSAIGSALGGAFSFLRRAVAWPFRMAGAAFGGAMPPPAPVEASPTVQDLRAQIANNEELAEGAARIARVIAQWVMDSVIADEPVTAPQPPQVSRSVANWLPGLTRDECLTLISADSQKIAAHIRGREFVDGVRPVQKLAPERWSPALPELVTEPSPGFLYHAFTGAACGQQCDDGAQLRVVRLRLVGAPLVTDAQPVLQVGGLLQLGARPRIPVGIALRGEVGEAGDRGRRQQGRAPERANAERVSVEVSVCSTVAHLGSP
jgi:hypothetical protein